MASSREADRAECATEALAQLEAGERRICLGAISAFDLWADYLFLRYDSYHAFTRAMERREITFAHGERVGRPVEAPEPPPGCG